VADDAPRRHFGAATWSALAVAVVGAVVAGVVVLGGGSEEDVAPAADSTWGAPTSGQARATEDARDESDAASSAEPGEESSAPRSSTARTRPAPTTSSPPAVPVTPTGSLDVWVPMTRPACDGSWVVFLGAATDPAAYEADVRTLLSSQPTAKYVLTQGSCSSMRQALPDGTLIYTVYVGPYPDQAAACSARAAIGGAAYVKRMDDVTPADQLWQC
jgi:cell division septation protein DedD